MSPCSVPVSTNGADAVDVRERADRALLDGMRGRPDASCLLPLALEPQPLACHFSRCRWSALRMRRTSLSSRLTRLRIRRALVATTLHCPLEAPTLPVVRDERREEAEKLHRRVQAVRPQAGWLQREPERRSRSLVYRYSGPSSASFAPTAARSPAKAAGCGRASPTHRRQRAPARDRPPRPAPRPCRWAAQPLPPQRGGRNRTADLPLTRRLLCQLSYAGPRTVYLRLGARPSLPTAARTAAGIGTRSR